MATNLPEGSVIRPRLMQLVVRDKMKDYGDRGDRLGLLSQARDFWMATSQVLHMLAKGSMRETLCTTVSFASQAEDG